MESHTPDTQAPQPLRTWYFGWMRGIGYGTVAGAMVGFLAASVLFAEASGTFTGPVEIVLILLFASLVGAVVGSLAGLMLGPLVAWTTARSSTPAIAISRANIIGIFFTLWLTTAASAFELSTANAEQMSFFYPMLPLAAVVAAAGAWAATGVVRGMSPSAVRPSIEKGHHGMTVSFRSVLLIALAATPVAWYAAYTSV